MPDPPLGGLGPGGAPPRRFVASEVRIRVDDQFAVIKRVPHAPLKGGVQRMEDVADQPVEALIAIRAPWRIFMTIGKRTLSLGCGLPRAMFLVPLAGGRGTLGALVIGGAMMSLQTVHSGLQETLSVRLLRFLGDY